MEKLLRLNLTADTWIIQSMFSHERNVIKIATAARATNSFACHSFNVKMCARLTSASTRNAHAILVPWYNTGSDGDVHRSTAQARSFAARSCDRIGIAPFAVAIVVFCHFYQGDDLEDITW